MQINHYLDVDLTLESRSPNRFLSQLLRPSLSEENLEESIRIIQIYMGLCLFGENLSQKMLLIRGEAGSGKSTLLDIFNFIAGHNSYHFEPANLDSNFEKGNILSKKIILTNDIDKELLSHKNANQLKAIVADGFTSYEQKNAKLPIKIKKRPMLAIFSTNFHGKLVRRREEDWKAWARRLLVVDFKFPNRERTISNFASVLWREEGAEILRWAMDGWAFFKENEKCLQASNLSLNHRDRVYKVVGTKCPISEWVKEDLEYCEDLFAQYKGIASSEAEKAFNNSRFSNISTVKNFPREIRPVVENLFKDSVEYSNKLRKEDGYFYRGYRGLRFKQLNHNKTHNSVHH